MSLLLSSISAYCVVCQNRLANKLDRFYPWRLMDVIANDIISSSPSRTDHIRPADRFRAKCEYSEKLTARGPVNGESAQSDFCESLVLHSQHKRTFFHLGSVTGMRRGGCEHRLCESYGCSFRVGEGSLCGPVAAPFSYEHTADRLLLFSPTLFRRMTVVSHSSAESTAVPSSKSNNFLFH